MAETFLPAWSQQGSSLPQSWNGNSLHGWDTLAQGVVWRLGEAQASLQPHGDVNVSQRRFLSILQVFFLLQAMGLSRPQSLSQQATKIATGWISPRTGACRGQSSHGARPEENGLYPDCPQHRTRCCV